MRRVLPAVLLTVLSIALGIGCSRQPPPHIGEWDAKLLNPEFPNLYRVFNQNMATSLFFLKNGTIQILHEKPDLDKPIIWEGKYTFDYSNNPISLDVEWKSGRTDSLHGIVRFIGEEKRTMEFCYSRDDKPRPSSFDNTQPCYWLTKKVKK